MTTATVALAVGVFLGSFVTALLRRPPQSVGRHRRTPTYSPSARGFDL